MAGKKVYRSMQGKIIDMELLAQKNELVPAIGNARMNARGDEIGPGGKIVRRREDIMAAYYENSTSAVKDEQYVRPKAVEAPKVTETKTTAKKEVKNESNKSKTDS